MESTQQLRQLNYLSKYMMEYLLPGAFVKSLGTVRVASLARLHTTFKRGVNDDIFW